MVGDDVTITVTPNDGYYHNLKVNGESVVLDWTNNTYTFKAKKTNYITGTFDTGIWNNNSEWILLNQNAGVLGTNYTDENAGWISASGNYNEIELSVKDFSKGTNKNFAVVAGFDFGNSTTAYFRLTDADRDLGDYCLQAWGSSVIGGSGTWGDIEAGTAVDLPSDIDDILKSGEAVVWKLALRNTDEDHKVLDMWINGTLRGSWDITSYKAAIVGNSEVVSAGLRHYNNPNSDDYFVEIPFTLSKVETTTVSISETENGVVTVNSAVNYIGDIVVLAATSKEGYT